MEQGASSREPGANQRSDIRGQRSANARDKNYAKNANDTISATNAINAIDAEHEEQRAETSGSKLQAPCSMLRQTQLTQGTQPTWNASLNARY